MYDPYKRSRNYRDARSAGRNTGYSGPTLEDFQSLLKAYNELLSSAQAQEKTLAEQQQKLQQQAQQMEIQAEQLKNQARQLEIKEEAIQRQTADIKKMDAELLWTKAALDQAQQQLEETQANGGAESNWQERYARLQAEVENLRRRWEQRSADRIDEERHQILRDMLPLADHLELALQHADKAEANEPGQSGLSQQFVDNIRATLQAFRNTLKRYHVEPIKADGQVFDPNLHEAVGRVESEVPADHVAEVVQTGYVSGDKLLRPARVLVSGG